MKTSKRAPKQRKRRYCLIHPWGHVGPIMAGATEREALIKLAALECDMPLVAIQPLWASGALTSYCLHYERPGSRGVAERTTCVRAMILYSRLQEDVEGTKEHARRLMSEHGLTT